MNISGIDTNSLMNQISDFGCNLNSNSTVCLPCTFEEGIFTSLGVLASGVFSAFAIKLIIIPKARRWYASYRPQSPEAQMLEQVRNRVKLGSDLDSSLKNSKTLLHGAAKAGYSTVATALLNAEATVDLKDAKGQTALHKACASKQVEIAKQLVQKGASREERDNQEQTPLMLLMQSGYDGPIDFLIPADPNKPNKAGDTHLHLAAYIAKPLWIQSLVAAGADPKVVNGKGQTALECLFRGQFPFGSFVNQYFADCFKDERKEHSKAVLESFERLNPRLKSLIEERMLAIHSKAGFQDGKKALASVKEDPYFSLIYEKKHHFKFSFFDGPPTVVSRNRIYFMGAALLEIKEAFNESEIVDPTKEIDPCLKPLLKDREDWQMAFQLACEYGQKKLADVLLKDANVDPNQPSPKNVLPVHAAIRSSKNGDFSFAQSLIASKKLDLKKAVDRNRDSVAHVAAEMGAKVVLEQLDKEGIDLNRANRQEMLPLQKAIEKRQEGAIRFLAGKMDSRQLQELKMGELSLIEYAVAHSLPGLREALNEKGIYFILDSANSKRLEKPLKEVWANDLKFLKEKGVLNIKELNQLTEELQGNEPSDPSELYAKVMLGIDHFLKQSALEENYKSRGKHQKGWDSIPLPFGDYLNFRGGFGDVADVIKSLISKRLGQTCKLGRTILEQEQNFATIHELRVLGGKTMIHETSMGPSAFRQKVQNGLDDLK